MKNWIINQSLDHPGRTVLISLILTFILGSGLRFFKVEDDMMKLLPQNMESRKTWDKVKEEFGNTEMIFIAFGKSGESVYKQTTLTSLWDFTVALNSIPDVEEVISMASMNRMDSEDGFLEINELLPKRVLNANQLKEVKTYLDSHPNVKTRVIGQHGDFLNVIVRPLDGAPNDILAEKLLDEADIYLGAYETHFGGAPYLTGVVSELIRNDVVMLVRTGMVVMVLILLLNLRSIPAVGMVLSVIFLSLFAMTGSMGWIRGLTGSDKFLFTLMNTSMPIILLTIANSDAVHVLAKFFKKFRKTVNKREAVQQTMDALILPIFLTSLTTAIAFLSLIFAPIEVMTGYGVSIAIGIIWAWILSSLMLPSLIMLKSWDISSRALTSTSILERFANTIGKVVLQFPRKVLMSGLTIVVVGLAGIFWLNVEVNIQSFFKKGTKIRESLEFLDREMLGTMDMQFYMQGDMKSPEVLNQMVELRKFLEEKPQISSTLSIAEVIQQMHRSVMDDDPVFETIPDSREKVNNLFTMYSMSGDPDDFSSLVDYDYSSGLTTTMLRNMSSSEIVKIVGETEDFVANELGQNTRVTITGMLVVFRDLVRLVVRSSFISIIVSIALIALIASLFFRRLIWGSLAVVPLVSAVILNYGMMGIFGIDLSHITAILSSIIIGVGVDFAIHYVSQFRRMAHSEISKDKLSRDVVDDVGYPIILDAFSNMAFGALLFSQFLPIQHMGGLMVFAMVSTSVGTLTLLAALAELMKNKLIIG